MKILKLRIKLQSQVIIICLLMIAFNVHVGPDHKQILITKLYDFRLTTLFTVYLNIFF